MQTTMPSQAPAVPPQRPLHDALPSPWSRDLLLLPGAVLTLLLAPAPTPLPTMAGESLLPGARGGVRVRGAGSPPHQPRRQDLR
jgi:hypothetical protein